MRGLYLAGQHATLRLYLRESGLQCIKLRKGIGSTLGAAGFSQP